MFWQKVNSTSLYLVAPNGRPSSIHFVMAKGALNFCTFCCDKKGTQILHILLRQTFTQILYKWLRQNVHFTSNTGATYFYTLCCDKRHSHYIHFVAAKGALHLFTLSCEKTCSFYAFVATKPALYFYTLCYRKRRTQLPYTFSNTQAMTMTMTMTKFWFKASGPLQIQEIHVLLQLWSIYTKNEAYNFSFV